jgi:hypothetical protein
VWDDPELTPTELDGHSLCVIRSAFRKESYQQEPEANACLPGQAFASSVIADRNESEVFALWKSEALSNALHPRNALGVDKKIHLEKAGLLLVEGRF